MAIIVAFATKFNGVTAMSSLTRCISVIARCSALKRSQAFKSLGITGCQHTYILNVCRNPGISQEQLANKIYVHKSNVARQVALLDKAGFLTRAPSSEDKRVMLIFPTAKAEAAYPVILQALKEWHDYLIMDFSKEEQVLLERMMNHVMDRARRYIDEYPEESIGEI